MREGLYSSDIGNGLFTTFRRGEGSTYVSNFMGEWVMEDEEKVLNSDEKTHKEKAALEMPLEYFL